MKTTKKTINILDYNREELTEYFVSIGESKFRANQIFQWVHQNGEGDFNNMSNLGLKLRQTLSETTSITAPEITFTQQSKDGTIKWVMSLADGNNIEAVFIPNKGRGTLCISSQVGCILDCSFCSTGKQGFNRNLTTAEIIGQLWQATRQFPETTHKEHRTITNVVFMGMGEPLANLDNVIRAISIMTDDFGYSISKRRVTVSTAGLIPAMEKLKAATDVALAVSLHAPNDELRNDLVPINKKYPLKDLLATCHNYFPAGSHRKVVYEYVLLKGINDQPEHARQLMKILKNTPAKINLIPFNPFPNTTYECSSMPTILSFQKQLRDNGFNTLLRTTRGDDITAACGQLVGKVILDKTKRQQKYANLGKAA